jgi:diguanylate cyclase (GGDEF)-like protein
LNVANRHVIAIHERRQTPPDDSEHPLRILVVDDDVNFRAWVAALTRRLGFWVETAEDGQAGLHRLSNAPYDAAIIDQEMPRLNGIELIRQLRAQEETKAIYAVMLTGREDMDTKLAALEAGFDDFLTKNSAESEIVAKLIAARRLASRQRTMKIAVRDLYGLATRDDLTGVFNRRFFISEAERMLAEGAIVNVVLIDIDDFKRVNDTYGHLAGDEVLRRVGTALQSSTRPDDVVARFGGDEFIVAVPDAEIEMVERIAARLATAIAALRWDMEATFQLGVSAGFASSRLLEKPTLAQLVNAADRDMYKNKWIRKHPDLRPELYEYPSQERDAAARLLMESAADQRRR